MKENQNYKEENKAPSVPWKLQPYVLAELIQQAAIAPLSFDLGGMWNLKICAGVSNQTVK